MTQMPATIQARIAQELASVLSLTHHAKIVLTLEFHCGSAGSIGALKIKRYMEDEVRP